MLPRLSHILSWKLVLVLLFVLIFINLVVLDYLVVASVNSFIDLRSQILKSTNIVLPEIKSQPTPVPTFPISNTCPQACISKISEATSSLKLSQLEPKNVSSSQPTTSVPAQSFSGVKEFFIPFGSGSNSTDDWADVSGLAATIDTNQYSQMKSVYFEVSLRIPTGNQTAYARLYNVTDKHPVWFSDVSLEGGTPKLVVSNPINLDSGKKLYQVQMKTSLKYPAFIDQARVHMTTY